MKRSAGLSLHIPEPKYRPGDQPDFSDMKIPAAGSVPRPDIAVRAKELGAYTDTLIRVLDDNGKSVGPWDPKLDPDMLHPDLLPRLDEQKRYDTRAQNLLALGNLRDPVAVEPLLGVLRDPSGQRPTDHRAYAAWSLGRIRDARSREGLQARLPDEQDPVVREEIERALREMTSGASAAARSTARPA